MNRQPDIDRLLRSWLDEGDDTPPERYVWAALERIQTTQQRGALWVSLEEFIMRAQPFASIAAIVVVAVIGFAVWFGLGGGPNIGDPDATPTSVSSGVETEVFADPFSLVPPDGWVTVESPNSVVVSPPIGTGSLQERIVIFRTEEATIWGGLGEGLMPWPEDLAAWLADYPVATEPTGPGSLEVTLASETETTVDGGAASVIAATSAFSADPAAEASMNFISPESANLGTDALIFDGEGQVRFVLLTERGVAIVYHATDSAFSEATFQGVLDSLRFLDR
ncbi:MAG: hypothetical protein ACRDGD_05780 [Candidatus Limnocylindria bacterium]